MGRGQDHHPSVGQEDKPHCQRGYSLFYWSAGLPLIGAVGWDPSHGSGAVSSVGMPWAWGGKQRSRASCEQLPARTARSCSRLLFTSYGAESTAFPGAVTQTQAGCGPRDPLGSPPQNLVYNWEMSGSFLCTIHLLPAGWDTACSGWGWLSKRVKGNPIAFLQWELIKLCLIWGTGGESPEQSSCCLCWTKSRLSYTSGISDLKE